MLRAIFLSIYISGNAILLRPTVVAAVHAGMVEALAKEVQQHKVQQQEGCCNPSQVGRPVEDVVAAVAGERELCHFHEQPHERCGGAQCKLHAQACVMRQLVLGVVQNIGSGTCKVHDDVAQLVKSWKHWKLSHVEGVACQR